MINLKYAVIKTLDAKFPTVPCYPEPVTQDFDRPAFYVEILPVHTKWINGAHIQREVIISIEYYPLERTVDACLAMEAQLLELFNGVLVAGDRVLPLGDMEFEEVHKELTCRMSLSYTDSLDETKVYGYDPTTQLMGDLTVSESLNEE